MDQLKTSSNRKPFQQRLKEIVLQNLNNEKFTISDIVSEIGISRSHLHQKIKRSFHKTINDYIREIRLEQAMKILIEEDCTAAETAYRVGFSTPTYFNKCFHDFFGYPPGEVRKLKSPDGLFNSLDEPEKIINVNQSESNIPEGDKISG